MEVVEVCATAFPFARTVTDEAFDGIPLVKERARRYARDKITPFCLLGAPTIYTPRSDAVAEGEPLQVRAFTLGESIRGNEESGVLVATWRRDENGGAMNRLRRDLSGVGLAQGEYLDARSGPGSARPFSMSWRARLRRFRVTDDFADFAEACSTRAPGAPCAALGEGLAAGQELIVH